MAEEKKIKVRALKPLNENGHHSPDDKDKGVFHVTAARAKALGKLVEVVK